MDFLQLFNGVVSLVKPVSADKSHAKTMDDSLADLGLDSLDFLMLAVYFGEIYGIQEQAFKSAKFTTPKELQEFIDGSKTQDPKSVDEALELVR